MGRSSVRHIAYITGTRADYGLMRRTLLAIQADPCLRLTVIATGMHLMPAFGNTIDTIRADGFAPIVVDAVHAGNERKHQAAFLADFFHGLVPVLVHLSPDVVLVLGDRPEMLAAATAGAYLGIPVAHIQGGEISRTIDEMARHAITKLSHLHFPATARSAERISKLGERPDNIFITGAPGLDNVREDALPQTAVRAFVKDTAPYLLVLQHPVSDELQHTAEHMRSILATIADTGYHAHVLYPNADPGHDDIIAALQQQKGVTVHRHMPRPLFLGMLRDAHALVGNSSAGVIEAASFGTPVVNIGTRQYGRERADNVIDSDYSEEALRTALRTALSGEFRALAREVANPYGDGTAATRIAQILATFPFDTLQMKQLTY